MSNDRCPSQGSVAIRPEPRNLRVDGAQLHCKHLHTAILHSSTRHPVCHAGHPAACCAQRQNAQDRKEVVRCQQTRRATSRA